MTAHPTQFSRRYRAALLDYLLGGSEEGLARAHGLGRMAIDEGLGLLPVLRTHQQAVSSLLESAADGDRRLSRLKASQEFLMETLSAFEMTHRGYLAMIDRQNVAASVESVPDGRRRRSVRVP